MKKFFVLLSLALAAASFGQNGASKDGQPTIAEINAIESRARELGSTERPGRHEIEAAMAEISKIAEGIEKDSLDPETALGRADDELVKLADALSRKESEVSASAAKVDVHVRAFMSAKVVWVRATIKALDAKDERLPEYRQTLEDLERRAEDVARLVQWLGEARDCIAHKRVKADELRELPELWRLTVSDNPAGCALKLRKLVALLEKLADQPRAPDAPETKPAPAKKAKKQ